MQQGYTSHQQLKPKPCLHNRLDLRSPLYRQRGTGSAVPDRCNTTQQVQHISKQDTQQALHWPEPVALCCYTCGSRAVHATQHSTQVAQPNRCIPFLGTNRVLIEGAIIEQVVRSVTMAF
jgi:hypothetical protein